MTHVNSEPQTEGTDLYDGLEATDLYLGADPFRPLLGDAPSCTAPMIRWYI